jgi:hypothetical protein
MWDSLVLTASECIARQEVGKRPIVTNVIDREQFAVHGSVSLVGPTFAHTCSSRIYFQRSRVGNI